MAHSLVRELAMACKKVAIYGSHHPLAATALERPFLLVTGIGRFRTHISFNLQQGHLYVMGIRMKESIFTGEIIQSMQVQDIGVILIDRMLSMAEFTVFVDRLVKRIDTSDQKNLLSTYLHEQKIASIEVNSETGFALFEKSKQYRGDVDGDFSVRRLALDAMGESLPFLARINAVDDNQLQECGINFDPEVVRYLLPERIASLPYQSIREELVEKTSGDSASDDSSADADKSAQIAGMARLADYHPDRQLILENLQDARISSPTNAAGSAPLSASSVHSQPDAVSDVLAAAFDQNNDIDPTDEFQDVFQRLLKTGQRGMAIEVVHQLMDRLISTEASDRTTALKLLLICIDQLSILRDSSVVIDVVDRIVACITQGIETYEYSEFIWRLLEKLMLGRHYELMARLTVGLAIRRRIKDTVTIYDSIAVKKVFSELSRPEIVKTLIDELITSSRQEVAHIRDVLIAAGSEEVALDLSRIISHPVRQVRQQALRILAELGKASLKVCSRILMDDSMFARETNRHELPDSQWYVLRNAIFVLGSLKDEAAIIPLRLRINDQDIRVRREIIRSLEKIGDEDACDLLIMMATDQEREIAEAAAIAIGAIGSEEIVPLVIDVIRRSPRVATKAINSLGKIGGEEATRFLALLLDDSEEFSAVQGGQVAKEDLHLAVIKALGQIGDDLAVGKVREFKENLSATQKIFFKNSPVNKEITTILSRSK